MVTTRQAELGIGTQLEIGRGTSLGCASIAPAEIMGSGGVGESDIMFYLGIIEQQKNNIINQYMALQKA